MTKKLTDRIAVTLPVLTAFSIVFFTFSIFLKGIHEGIYEGIPDPLYLTLILLAGIVGFSSILFWVTPFWIIYLLATYLISRKVLKLNINASALTLIINVLTFLFTSYVYYSCYTNPVCLSSDSPLGSALSWIVAFGVGQLLWTNLVVRLGFRIFSNKN
jgi:hypothetical protein